MDEIQKARLRLRIERLRKKLYSCKPERLLKTSQGLDKLVVEYQKLSCVQEKAEEIA